MEAPRELLAAARTRAGLSAAALARRAGVATTTVVRIERGDMEPTFSIMDRLLSAAGEQLRVSTDTSNTPVELARLIDAWLPAAGTGGCPDWTRLRAALDALQQRPDAVATAIDRAPARSGAPVLDALLAGIADKLADDHHLARPSWTSKRKLKTTWAPAATPRQRAYQETHTPPQLREHNVIVDADTLWRGERALA
jgi:transcriptional regulator with XRE-family HTH domain